MSVRAEQEITLTRIDSDLTYDHSYEMSQDGTTATFAAHVYKGGVDIHTNYETTDFTWYLKNEDVADKTYLGSGYTCTVQLSQCGYGSEVIGYFTIDDDAVALTVNNDNLTTRNGENITVRTSGDSVRVRDLSVSTALYSSEKILIVGNENEHLITVQTLQDYLNLNLDKQVLFNTTSGWNAQTTLQSQANTLYVYTDYQTDANNNNVAGIKVGDGNAYVVDLPFTDAKFTEHASDTTIHVTSSERTKWNSAVKCYYTGTENLVFTNV